MYLTKDEWLAQYRNRLGPRDMILLGRAYDVLKRNTIVRSDAPWGAAPVISPWTGGSGEGIWNWDSAFHAMTVSRFDGALAESCIDTFVKYMLPNGLLPDVIFDDGTIVDNYGKPPVMPWAILTVFERTRNRDFLRRSYDAMVKNERFWTENRMDRGLFFYSAQTDPYAEQSLHPRYESGWDNSPRWDSGIVHLWAIDLNCYMVLLYRSMAKMALLLGEPATVWQERESALVRRIEETLFDPHQAAYVDRNRETGAFSDVLSPASFMPLFVGIASLSHADAMHRLARDPRKFYPGIPTVSYDSPAFSTDYWRGQTWLNVAYFAIRGLSDYGFSETAAGIREFLLDMIYDEIPRGMFENYDSLHRRGCYNSAFSWTAAFVIELILSEQTEFRNPPIGTPVNK